MEELNIPLLTPSFPSLLRIELLSTGRHGPKPSIKNSRRYKDEARHIANRFRRLHDKQEIPWYDMYLTYACKWMGKKLNEIFKGEGVPCKWLGTSDAKKRFRLNETSVKLMTMHSSKELWFPLVAVSGVGHLPGKQMDNVDDAKLLYVAMTRST